MINNVMAPLKNDILTFGVMKYLLNIYFHCSLVTAALCSFKIEIFVLFKGQEVEHVITWNMAPHLYSVPNSCIYVN